MDICEAKINRAEARLEDIKLEIDRFFGKSEPHTIPGDYDVETHTFTFRFGFGEPPVILDLLVGEIAQGLRSALNNLVAGLSDSAKSKADFPIFISESDYLARGAQKIAHLAASQRQTIEGLQPYHQAVPADAPLAILNHLCRIDKHREGLFQAVAEVYASATFYARRDIESYGAVEIFAGVMKDGDPLAKVEIVPSGPNPKLDIHTEFMAGIAFDQRWTLPHPFPALIGEVRRIVGLLAMP